MRDIKFRAWQKDGTKMIDLQKITPLILSHDQDGVFLPFHKDIYIMQYTGLKDKNGVEIYENDLIKGDLYDSRLPTMGEVVFDEHFSFYANKNEAGNTPLHRITNIKIIGNIYENPELVDK